MRPVNDVVDILFHEVRIFVVGCMHVHIALMWVSSGALSLNQHTVQVTRAFVLTPEVDREYHRIGIINFNIDRTTIQCYIKEDYLYLFTVFQYK